MQGSLGIPVIKSPASQEIRASKGPANLTTPDTKSPASQEIRASKGPANLTTPDTKSPGNLGTRASKADRSTRHRTAATPAAAAAPTERRAARAPTGLPARIARSQGQAGRAPLHPPPSARQLSARQLSARQLNTSLINSSPLGTSLRSTSLITTSPRSTNPRSTNPRSTNPRSTSLASSNPLRWLQPPLRGDPVGCRQVPPPQNFRLNPVAAPRAWSSPAA
jgi:hypothetical protein